jgi:alanyl-tRNA synthetase
MQQHTAEHILSGLLHSLYGIENVGFHLGHDDVTFDTDKPLTVEMLSEVEALANEAVWKNVSVDAVIYKDGKTEIAYRSKMEIDEELRLVTIDGYDVCACCAPHVAQTGEIGLIKLIYSEKHKGGSRIYMLAGKRAYEYTNVLISNAKQISNLLCAKVEDIGTEVEALIDRMASKDRLIAEKNGLISSIYSEGIKPTTGNFVICLKGLDIAGAREFANRAAERVGGFLVCLVGEEGDYKYLIHHNSESILKTALADINSALCGRGGGRGNMVSGSFAAELSRIKEYFS